jgi:hypothetical protein
MIKKAFLITVMSIITTSVFAQYGTLTITNNSNQKFWLFIEDVLQNEYSTHSIRIQGLQLTAYRVRVEMDNADNNCVGQTIQISYLPNQNNYMVSRDRQNNYLFGKSNMQANPYFIQNVILPDYAYSSAYQQYLYPGFNPNVNYGQNQYKGSTYKGYQQGGRGYGGNQGYGNQGYGGNQGHGTPPPPACMPMPDFNKALSVIQGESFENSRLNTAKQITSKNYLCVSQIIQICRTFSYEQTKLDFAKYAYHYCVDKNNYFQLNEVFSYAASKDELRKYIDGR